MTTHTSRCPYPKADPDFCLVCVGERKERRATDRAADKAERREQRSPAVVALLDELRASLPPGRPLSRWATQKTHRGVVAHSAHAQEAIAAATAACAAARAAHLDDLATEGATT